MKNALWLCSALALAACTPSSPPPRYTADGDALPAGPADLGGADATDADPSDSAPGEPDAPGDRDNPDNDGDESPFPATGDGALLRAIVAGDIAPEVGFIAIAQSGGFPIETPQGFLFARLHDAGSPHVLVGDHTNWQDVAMHDTEHFQWVLSEVPSPAGSLYKYRDKDGVYWADPLARAHGYDDNGEYSLVRGAHSYLARWPHLTDGAVAPRAVYVWVPELPPTHHLYVHDGQDVFNPYAPFGGWQLQTQVARTTLVIGIASTSERIADYTHVADDGNGGGADAYADFVELTLRPTIESTYGTPLRVGVLGASLGGLVSLYQALRFPDAFDFVGSMSGTLGWGSINDDNTTLIELYANLETCPSSVLYLDSGGNDGGGCYDTDGDGLLDDNWDSDDNYCETRQFADTLSGVGCAWGDWSAFAQDGTLTGTLFHWHEPDAAHNEAAWRARVARPLSLFEAL